MIQCWQLFVGSVVATFSLTSIIGLPTYFCAGWCFSGMMQNVMVLNFSIFLTTSCADCLLGTSRFSSCVIANLFATNITEMIVIIILVLADILTLTADSVFPLMRFLCNRHYSTVITLLFMCLCCLSPFLCFCMLTNISAHSTFSIFPLV